MSRTVFASQTGARDTFLPLIAPLEVEPLHWKKRPLTIGNPMRYH